MDDKTTDLSKPYTPENLIEYEIMTRDSRIGEITNTATSIENDQDGIVAEEKDISVEIRAALLGSGNVVQIEHNDILVF